ncbi:hypothetical protein Nepgr_000350 [Nepenthes gracilis]|uniref:Uncharacterized protein n=1 Tax=Nepenthes gracilis TaxID=150966 RepID=A0AAD3P2Z1_NEPGR|nr:hypothetical protein Nepgr_000350 [Nepenthes gracilis]
MAIGSGKTPGIRLGFIALMRYARKVRKNWRVSEEGRARGLYRSVADDRIAGRSESTCVVFSVRSDNLCCILKLNGIKEDNGYMGNFVETESMCHIEGDSGHMPTDDGDDFLLAEGPKDAHCDEDIHSEMSNLGVVG